MGLRFCGWVHVNAICIPPVYVKKGVGTPNQLLICSSFNGKMTVLAAHLPTTKHEPDTSKTFKN